MRAFTARMFSKRSSSVQEKKPLLSSIVFPLILSALAVVAAYTVTDRVYENLAHLEDEQAFAWEASVIARGKLTLPSPPESKSFLWPFVVDYQGQRFGKYPLGWPAVLSIGYLLGIRSLINPLLAGLGVWLTYLLGKRIFGAITGLIAAGLTLMSPFFLMISGSLLSHPLGLVLSALFALCWLTAFIDDPTPQPSVETHRVSKQWLAAIGAGFALGGLAFTRPWTAVGVALPFAFHGFYLLVRGDNRHRLMLFLLAGIAFILGSFQLAWQWRATGNPFLNLYTLWWSYDKIGFGPGHGVKEAGHTLKKGIEHALFSFRGWFPELFGWKSLSLIFIPLGIVATLRLPSGKRLPAVLAGCVIAGLVLVHLAYWVGSYILGPRYYYEGLYSLTIFSAAGIALLAGWPIQGVQPFRLPTADAGKAIPELINRIFTRITSAITSAWISFNRSEKLKRLRYSVGSRIYLRWIPVSILVSGLVLYNLVVYLPQRMEPLYGLYGVSYTYLTDFLKEPSKDSDTMGVFHAGDFRPEIDGVVDPITGDIHEIGTPVLVIVHVMKKWIEYGTLLELQSPFLDSPFIFVISKGEQEDRNVAAHFPDRNVIHYYPREPIKFFTRPR